MASEFNLKKEIAQEVDSVADSFKKLYDILSKTVDLVIENKNAFEKLSRSQSDTAKKTDTLTAEEKELETIQKRSEKITLETVKASEQLRKKRKELTEQVKKDNGETQKSVSFTNKMAGAFKTAFVQIAAVIATARGAMTAFKNIVASTQTTADRFEATIQGVKAAYSAFNKAIASGDLNNVFKNMKAAFQAGKEYAAALDDLGDRQRDLNVTEAEATVRIERLTSAVQNVLLSEKERIKAAEEIFQIEKSLLEQKQSVRKQDFEAQVKIVSQLSGLEEDRVLQFIKNYDEESALREKAMQIQEMQHELGVTQYKAQQTFGVGYSKSIKEQKQALEDFISTLSDSEKEYFLIFNAYSKTTDEELDKVVQSYVSLQNAESESVAGLRRITNQYNSLIKQITEKEEKRVEQSKETQKQILDIENQTVIEIKELYTDSDLYEDLKDFQWEFAQEQIDAQKWASDEISKILEDKAEEDKQKAIDKQQEKEEAINAIKEEAINAAAQFASERLTAKVDEELAMFMAQQEDEKAILQEKLDSGEISQKEYNDKIAAMELKAKQKSAQADKKKALYDIAINTAVGIAKAIPNLILMGVAAATGALQAAVVAARPIPKFRHGGMMKETGLAEFSETGSELLKLPGGRAILTPEERTVGIVPKGARFYSAHSPETIAAKEGGITVEKYDELIKETRRMTKAISDLEIHNSYLTARGLENFIQKGRTKIIYKDLRTR